MSLLHMQVVLIETSLKLKTVPLPFRSCSIMKVDVECSVLCVFCSLHWAGTTKQSSLNMTLKKMVPKDLGGNMVLIGRIRIR